MQKSLFSSDYKRFLTLLREKRKHLGFTQEQVAERLQTTQSFISKCERGERRLDVIELKAWCNTLNISLSDFVSELDSVLEQT